MGSKEKIVYLSFKVARVAKVSPSCVKKAAKITSSS